jgi:hypothetical protein
MDQLKPLLLDEILWVQRGVVQKPRKVSLFSPLYRRFQKPTVPYLSVVAPIVRDITLVLPFDGD